MYKQYCISGDRNKDAGDDDEVKELALSANSDIICYHCGGKGHKKNNCPKLKINLGKTKVMARATKRRNSRTTATIVGNLAIRRPIVRRNTQRRNKLNIGRMIPAMPIGTFWL